MQAHKPALCGSLQEVILHCQMVCACLSAVRPKPRMMSVSSVRLEANRDSSILNVQCCTPIGVPLKSVLTAQAILSINPDVYFALSGTGQARFYPGMAWGNGFITDPATIRQYNLSDPSGFFEDIAAVPALANRTLLSVHVYGPNITVRAAAALTTTHSAYLVVCVLPWW